MAGNTGQSSSSIFPTLTQDDILAFQFSAWYPKLSHISIKSTIIRPLSDHFRRYLLSDGVLVPAGSDDHPVESTLPDSESDTDDGEPEDSHYPQLFSFPDLDAQIRKAIQDYGAVFPKLNFSSPKDASWVLPASSPLKCTSPADVYMLLKSSDFISHDLSSESVFEGCELSDPLPSYELELVLKKWYHVDSSREFRCFIRRNQLIGISQRDSNFYEFMNDAGTRIKIVETLTHFWESEIKPKWPTPDYVCDVLLTRDLGRGHVMDFNPWAPRTDPLLFTYEELQDLSQISPPAQPTFKHNMVPFEALALSSGQTVVDFARLWQDELKRSMEGN